MSVCGHSCRVLGENKPICKITFNKPKNASLSKVRKQKNPTKIHTYIMHNKNEFRWETNTSLHMLLKNLLGQQNFPVTSQVHIPLTYLLVQ